MCVDGASTALGAPSVCSGVVGKGTGSCAHGAARRQIRTAGAARGSTAPGRAGYDQYRSACPICSKCRIYDHNGSYGVAAWSPLRTERRSLGPETVGTQAFRPDPVSSKGVRMRPEAGFRLYSVSVSSVRSFSDTASVSPFTPVDGLSSAALSIGSRSW